MDPLTQKLLDRTRARRENLAKKMAENQISPPRHRVPLGPNTVENTEKGSVKDTANTCSSLDIGGKSSMKSRLQLIATQRSQWDQEGRDMDSSPVLPTASMRKQTEISVQETTSKPVPKTTKARFAALAENINSWVDDLDHPKHRPKEQEKPSRKWTRPEPREEEQTLPAPRSSQPTTTTQKQTMLDLKASTITTKTAESALKSVTFSQPKKNIIKARSPIKDSVKQPIPAKRNVNMPVEAAAPKQAISRDTIRNNLGNSRMGEVPFQQVVSRRIATSKPERQICEEVVKKTEVTQAPKVAQIKSPEKRAVTTKKESPKKRHSTEKPNAVMAKKKAIEANSKETVLSPTRVEPRVGAMAKSIHDRLQAHQDKWHDSEINRKVQADRQKEMAVLRGRWDSTQGAVVKYEENQEAPVIEAENSEESMEDDDNDEGDSYNMTDIDADISSNDGSAHNSPQKEGVEGDESKLDESVNLTDVLNDIDQLITEAEHGMKGGEKQSQLEISQLPAATSTPKEETKEELKVAPVQECTPQAPPRKPPQQNLYDVQSYRSQTKQPVIVVERKIVREEEAGARKMAERRTPRAAPRKISNREKIQTLQEEVAAQQSIIHQTTQALSLIASNENFKNTQEEIEAEKMLVIASQKMQACLTEIQYLKNSPAEQVMYTEDGEEIEACKGAITIKDVRLPFKTEYLIHLESNPDAPSHYYFLVFKCGASVSTSQLLNTKDDLSGDCLKFNNLIAMNDLDSDFSVEVLVYQMRGTTAKVEGLAQRSHLMKQGRFGSLTPKKLLSNKGKVDKSLPAPSASGSRSSSFALVGSVRLSLASCQSNKFILSRVPFTSPLEGSIHLCMTCRKNSSTIERGFLTMFDDISGFGSWHRRWCVLAEGHVSWWKYPDDEKHKPPIGSIDLRDCTTQEVALMSRIVCARPNTFELVTVRPASRHEKETLISKCENSVVTTKFMISADTKEDRLQWIDSLNKTLMDLRMWNKDASKK